ncbi:HNH endonuclease signature motif containing protein [Streptomyces spongiicola]|uniref:HNH endonuclease n=1 Tax=Streptomyces spongiicola TaxID=1690221 RepID=A0ABM6V4L3_9ACTN|nr:HNH endonuclease signature motif containing protein [Streptomyces spongiicola]AWK08853.1 HNH endonuclease [Streptomyces spongiicola]
MPVSPYTRERLTAAARTSRTLSEALGKLGVEAKGASRSYIRTRMKRLGVDTSHFEREGTRWTREILEAAVAESTNLCEVLRRLGVDVVGGQHTHIARRVRALEIDISHFTTPQRTEKARGNHRRLTAEDILVDNHTGHGGRTPHQRLRRALLEWGMSERCALCGMEPVWHGRRLPLEIDHIDGDWRNNRAENLRFLCPNCHSTTDTYRGRAKARIKRAQS